MEDPTPKKTKAFTRRAFLKGMGGGAAGAALTTRLLGERPGPSPLQAAGAEVLSTKTIAFTVNGRRVSLEVEPRETLLEVLEGPSRADRRQEGLRQGRMRRLHRPGRRPDRLLMPVPRDPGGRKSGRDHRGVGLGGNAPPHPAGVYREGWLSVRLLHAGGHHGLGGAAQPDPLAFAPRDQVRAVRQPLPLRQLRQDLRVGRGSGPENEEGLR